MFKKFLSSILVLVCGISLVACVEEVSVVKETQTTEVKIEETTVVAKSEKLTFNIEKVDISDIEDEKTYQEIKYPVITCNDPTLQKSLDAANKELKEVAEEFKYLNRNEVRNQIVEMNDENIVYASDTDASVSYQGNNYLSIVTNRYVFTMGAHGSTQINGYNYDIKTGKRLKLFDFIKDKEELRKYLKDWTKKQEEGMIAEWAEGTIDEYLDTDELELQCAIKDGELSVIFQQYDIAAYAVGIIEVPIDKSLLKVDIN